MKHSPAKEVEVDLGEAGILILQYPKVLTPAQRKHTQQILEQVAAQPGRQTLVLEAGVKYRVIQRGSSKAELKGCGKAMAVDQFWSFCGETHPSTTIPALCEGCGGPYALRASQ